MLAHRKTQAALLTGLSMIVLSAVSAQANTVNWGAVKAPADIISPEPARKADKKSKKSKAAKSAPAEVARTEYRASQPAASDAAPTGVMAFTDGRSSGVKATESIDAEVRLSRAKKTKSKSAKAEKKAKKTARVQKSEPIVPDGPLHIIVSVDAQRASLYANGTFVASTTVSTGTQSHPTPLGVFSVIQKNRHHVSNLYGAPMPYMQRLTWSGTAMHTGPLPGYPASHGCIRLTDDFAQMLWKATRIGARVIVTRDDVKPVEISHARLLIPMAPVAQSQPAADAAETTGALVRTADATASVTVPEPTRPLGTFKPIIRDVLVEPPTRTPSSIERKQSPVSIFISRKDSKIYVRQAMQPLFDLPLTIREPNKAIGTHVYTAMELKDGALRWTAVSVPSVFAPESVKPEKSAKRAKKSQPEPVVATTPVPSASAALDRIDIPQDAVDRLAGLVAPGASLIVSDNPLSHETGKYTDFIVLTR